MLCLDENGHHIGKTAQGLYEMLTPHHPVWFYNGTRITDERQVY